MLDPSAPGFYKLTDADIPALKAHLAGGGGVYIGPALAKAAAEKGFVEGVHFHILRPIPTEHAKAYVSVPLDDKKPYWPPSYVKTGIYR